MENEELMNTIKALKEELESLKAKKETKSRKKYKPRVKKEQNPPIIEPKRGGGIRFKGNTWNDDGVLCSEDKSFDKKVAKKSKRVDRTRDAAVAIKVVCNRCHKEFSTFIDTGSSYYVCGKCGKS